MEQLVKLAGNVAQAGLKSWETGPSLWHCFASSARMTEPTCIRVGARYIGACASCP